MTANAITEQKKQRPPVTGGQIPQGGFMVPKTLDEAYRVAKVLAASSLVPKEMRNNVPNIMVALQMGAEVGLSVMQSVQNICVIGGRPSIWGDSLIGIVKVHKDYEKINETFDEKTMTATCEVKRAGEDPVIRKFSESDARQAMLWNKEGPWQTYPKRMLQMRARGWAIRDSFPDAIKGLKVAEEVMDYSDIREVHAEIIDHTEVPEEVTAKRRPDTFGGSICQDISELFESQGEDTAIQTTQEVTNNKEQDQKPEPDQQPEPEPAQEDESQERPEFCPAYDHIMSSSQRQPRLMKKALEEFKIKNFADIDGTDKELCDKIYTRFLGLHDAAKGV